jgi:hypothetical protein
MRYKHKLSSRDEKALISEAIHKIKNDFQDYTAIYETKDESLEDLILEMYLPIIRKQIIMFLAFMGHKTSTRSIFKSLVDNLDLRKNKYIPYVSSKVFQIVFDYMWEAKPRYYISTNTIKSVWAFIILNIHYEKLDHYISESRKIVAKEALEAYKNYK